MFESRNAKGLVAHVSLPRPAGGDWLGVMTAARPGRTLQRRAGGCAPLQGTARADRAGTGACPYRRLRAHGHAPLQGTAGRCRVREAGGTCTGSLPRLREDVLLSRPPAQICLSRISKGTPLWNPGRRRLLLLHFLFLQVDGGGRIHVRGRNVSDSSALRGLEHEANHFGPRSRFQIPGRRPP